MWPKVEAYVKFFKIIYKIFTIKKKCYSVKSGKHGIKIKQNVPENVANLSNPLKAKHDKPRNFLRTNNRNYFYILQYIIL